MTEKTADKITEKMTEKTPLLSVKKAIETTLTKEPQKINENEYFMDQLTLFNTPEITIDAIFSKYPIEQLNQQPSFLALFNDLRYLIDSHYDYVYCKLNKLGVTLPINYKIKSDTDILHLSNISNWYHANAKADNQSYENYNGINITKFNEYIEMFEPNIDTNINITSNVVLLSNIVKYFNALKIIIYIDPSDIKSEAKLNLKKIIKKNKLSVLDTLKIFIFLFNVIPCGYKIYEPTNSSPIFNSNFEGSSYLYCDLMQVLNFIGIKPSCGTSCGTSCKLCSSIGDTMCCKNDTIIDMLPSCMSHSSTVDIKKQIYDYILKLLLIITNINVGKLKLLLDTELKEESETVKCEQMERIKYLKYKQKYLKLKNKVSNHIIN